MQVLPARRLGSCGREMSIRQPHMLAYRLTRASFIFDGLKEGGHEAGIGDTHVGPPRPLGFFR